MCGAAAPPDVMRQSVSHAAKAKTQPQGGAIEQRNKEETRLANIKRARQRPAEIAAQSAKPAAPEDQLALAAPPGKPVVDEIEFDKLSTAVRVADAAFNRASEEVLATRKLLAEQEEKCV